MCIAEHHKALGRVLAHIEKNMLGMEEQERNRINCVTWVGGFQLQLKY